MSSEGIFLQVGDQLQLLKEQAYDSEDLLQVALARHPEVIAGSSTESEGDGRLLLITREMGVPAVASGPSWFSLDHLFIDHEGVPVLVEVKRSSDTRIRREVIGQMLDYAANGVKYWPLRLLREQLEKRAAEEDSSVEELLGQLQPGLDPEEFWRTVESNLLAGRVRMIFVADALPPELVRVIEFLNEQMNPAEVLGVELRQFVAGDHVAYVPRVVGRTSYAIDKKDSSGQRWTRESFLEIARERCSAAELDLAERLLAHVDEHGSKLAWGSGASPGVGGWYEVNERPTGVWVLNTSSASPTTRPYLVFYFGDLVAHSVTDRLEAAAATLERIPGLRSKIQQTRSSGWKKYPKITLAEALADPAHETAVFDAITALVDPKERSPHA
ncbi:hypothetical protein [Kribbella sp. NPDC051770]|uniref:hypothetical protein n=1 Tax=Kribbella sp. NPDC051770 TaxID=3155413 RepID=UPI003439C8BC